MPRVYDSVDLMWTSRGDCYIQDGDLMDTSLDPLRSLVQEVKTRASADIGDWNVFPDIGSNISDLVGEPNNKITAESMKTKILSALARHGFILTSDLEISYVPVDIDKLMVRIKIKVAPTLQNGKTEFLVVASIYNYKEDQILYMM
jgi:hypothetical protein